MIIFYYLTGERAIASGIVAKRDPVISPTPLPLKEIRINTKAIIKKKVNMIRFLKSILLNSKKPSFLKSKSQYVIAH